MPVLSVLTVDLGSLKWSGSAGQALALHTEPKGVRVSRSRCRPSPQLSSSALPEVQRGLQCILPARGAFGGRTPTTPVGVPEAHAAHPGHPLRA